MKLSDIYLRLDLGKLWGGEDVFSAVQQLKGDVFRHKEGRRTLRFEVAGKSYFLKYHQGVGWLEIVKNLLQLRILLTISELLHSVQCVSTCS